MPFEVPVSPLGATSSVAGLVVELIAWVGAGQELAATAWPISPLTRLPAAVATTTVGVEPLRGCLTTVFGAI